MRTFIWYILLMVSALGQTSPEQLGIARLETPSGASGSAVLIAHVDTGLALYATAAHVVIEGDSPTGPIPMAPVFKLFHADGTVSKNANVSVYDRDVDLAVLWARDVPTAAVPLEMIDTKQYFAPITLNYQPPRHTVMLWGYGFRKWTQTDGYASIATDKRILSDLIGIPGQSGGALVLNGRLAGILSGGHDWYKDTEGKGNITWPARCGSVDALRPLVLQALKVQGK
jgi:hypothetical protein